MIYHLLPCRHLRISRSYISRMLSPGIVIPINPNGASALLVHLGHIPEFSRAVFTTAISGPIEQIESIIILNAIKDFPD